MLISIITPCLNRAVFVEEAVESVREQDHPSVEHIIMDGGSTDGTLEVLQRYPHLRIYSQPDEGIYDALNKGIRLSQGEVIGFLNTDDRYEPGIFGAIAQAFINNPGIDALVGGASIYYEKGRGECVTYTTFPTIPQGELLERATQGAPIFNAWFFRRRLFDELGVFEPRFLYVADRDFLIRMAFKEKPYTSLDRVLYHYRMHPGSFTLSGQDSGEAGYMFESRALAERYLRMKGMSREESQCFKLWHSQIILEQVMTSWRQKNFGRMARYMLLGVRFNISWPLIYAHKLIERFPYITGRRSSQ